MTVSQIISDVLRELGVIGSGDPLEDDDATTALRYFQMMDTTFRAKGLMPYAVARNTSFALTAGQQTRTIGIGGNFSVERPVFVPHIGVIPVGQTDEIIVTPYRNREEWLAEPWKAQTDLYPSRYLYERTIPYGTFTFWPIPTTAAALAIALPTLITAPATLLTDLVFPEGYYETYHTNLLVRLARPFQTTATQEQKDAARDSLGVTLRLNDQGPPPAQFDPGLTGGSGGWDIRSNGYRS